MQREKATHALRAWNPAKRVGCRSILHGEGARQGEGILPFPPGRSRAWGITTAHPRKPSRKARAWTSPPQEKMNLALSRMDSVIRTSLRNVTAARRFAQCYGEDVLEKLGIGEIAPGQVS